MEIKLLTTAYTDLLKNATHTYGEQHQAIAKNVANVNTDGYKRIDTDFSERLKSAVGNSGIKTSQSKHISHSNWSSSSTSSDNPEGSVDLAREMTDLSVNQIRFEFVTRALARHYSGISTAIVGRNR